MNRPAYRQAIIDYIRAQAKPPDKLSHQQRLYKLAVRLAGDEAFDDEILFAAAWLHDLGVFIGHRPEDPAALAKWDNVAYAAQQAPALLKQFGFPVPKIPAVAEVIRTHLPSGEPKSREGILLRDADLLEQCGAVGILRTVSKVGRDSRFIYFSDAVEVLRRNMQQLPIQLKLPTARNLARARIETLRSFLESVEKEAEGDL